MLNVLREIKWSLVISWFEKVNIVEGVKRGMNVDQTHNDTLWSKEGNMLTRSSEQMHVEIFLERIKDMKDRTTQLPNYGSSFQKKF